MVSLSLSLSPLDGRRPTRAQIILFPSPIDGRPAGWLAGKTAKSRLRTGQSRPPRQTDRQTVARRALINFRQSNKWPADLDQPEGGSLCVSWPAWRVLRLATERSTGRKLLPEFWPLFVGLSPARPPIHTHTQTAEMVALLRLSRVIWIWPASKARLASAETIERAGHIITAPREANLTYRQRASDKEREREREIDSSNWRPSSSTVATNIDDDDDQHYQDLMQPRRALLQFRRLDELTWPPAGVS